MDALPPAPPFSERHQFLARFAQDAGHTAPVQVSIEYSMVVPGTITGAVLGGPETQTALWSASHDPHLSFRSEPTAYPPGWQHVVKSDEVVFKSITGYDSSTEGLVRRAADIEAFSLTTDETRGEDSYSRPREVIFYLYGPPNVWNLRPDLDGDSDYTNADLDVSSDLFRVALGMERHHKTDPDDPTLGLRRAVYTLSVEPLAPAADLDDDAFLDAARALADDVLLLVSFASKTWIDWFRYTLHSGRRTLRHVRSTSRTPETAFRHMEKMVVRQEHVRSFLSTALPLYREADRDLRTPLLMHVGTKDVTYAEAQFLTQFTVLEALRNRFVQRDGSELILGKSAAQKVRRALREALRALDLPEDAAAAIEAKIPELNRHSAGPTLDRLLSSLDLQLGDLYPPDVPSTLLRTRNRLVHGDVAIGDSGEFFRESTRLSALLDRLLLRSLGWTDLSLAPSEHDLDYLRRPADPAPDDRA